MTKRHLNLQLDDEDEKRLCRLSLKLLQSGIKVTDSGLLRAGLRYAKPDARFIGLLAEIKNEDGRRKGKVPAAIQAPASDSPQSNVVPEKQEEEIDYWPLV